jgi:hypothetical protein
MGGLVPVKDTANKGRNQSNLGLSASNGLYNSHLKRRIV